MKKRFLLLAAVLIICVAALAMPASAAEHADHSSWTELTAAGGNLSAGSYYLAGDVKATDRINITADVTLCLSGHVLDLNGYAIFVSGDATLNLCDCNGTNQTHKFMIGIDGLWTLDDSGDKEVAGGVITGGDGVRNGSYIFGGGVCVNSGTFNMYGGSIVGNSATYGGGVYTQDSSFNMYGGNIRGNLAGENGGGAELLRTTSCMSGGSITENTARHGGGVLLADYTSFNLNDSASITANSASVYGGGVLILSNSALDISGGSIVGNSATTGTGVMLYDNSAQLKLSGAPEIDGDIRLDSKPIIITGALTGNTPFLLLNASGTFTSGWGTYMGTADPADYFPIDRTGYHVERSGNEATVLPNTYTVTFNPNGGDGSMEPQSFTYDKPQKLSANQFTKTGYSFTVWKLDDSTTFDDKQEAKNLTSVNGATVTLTAQWKANVYNVTLNTNEGTIADGKDITSYTYGVGAKLPTEDDIERRGYRFYGWYASEDFSGDPVTEITATDLGDMVFYAKWVRLAGASYSITVKESDGGSVTVTPSSASKGLTITVKIKPDEGYVLDELIVTDANGNELKLNKRSDTEYSFSMPGSAVTVKATFVNEDGEVESGLPFDDVDVDDWFYDAVEYAYENELMNGVADDEFAPNSTLTRGMMATLLYRLEGEPDVTGVAFDDIGTDMWYTDAITWAAANEIVNGYGDGVFTPNDAITREQLAAILYRYAQYKGMEAVDLKENLTGFDDGDSVSEYAVSAMNWAVGAGLMNGVTDTTLQPQGTATRAQVATMLMRFVEYMAD